MALMMNIPANIKTPYRLKNGGNCIENIGILLKYMMANPKKINAATTVANTLGLVGLELFISGKTLSVAHFPPIPQ